MKINNKFNFLIKKNIKGFTLLELLGVILIITFIILVVVPTINRAVESSKEKLYQAQASNIESAAKIWAADNPNVIPKKNNETTTVFLYTLKNSGILDDDLINPLTDKKFPDNTLIEIKRDNNFFEYKVIKDSGTEDFIYDEETPMIVLMGAIDDTVQLNYFTHNWANAEAIKLIDKDGNLIEGTNVDTVITIDSEVISEIDTNILREYLVEYKINYNGFEKSILRKVNLVDTLPPSIAFSTNNITVEQCSTYDWITEGFTASDNSGSFDIVVAGTVECVPGNYSLTYTLTDINGNIAIRTRNVSIVEELAGGGGEEPPTLPDNENITYIYDLPGIAENATPCEINGLEFTHIEDKRAVDPLEHKTYAVNKIGNQCWFAENLAYTGNDCLVSGGTVWDDNEPFNACNTHSTDWGTEVLYQWGAAMNGNDGLSGDPVQGLCPVGWVLPTDNEFTTLTDYLSANSEYWCGGVSTQIAKSLASTTNWIVPENALHDTTCAVGENQSLNNATGFTALPTVFRFTSGSLSNSALNSLWWSSSPDGSNARMIYLSFDRELVYAETRQQPGGLSVRCLLGP